MQRKAYVTGIAALLAALLAGCTSGSSGGDDISDKNADTGTSTVAAQPGKYRSLPEPCGAVGQNTLDSLLPGIAQITDEEQRDKAYAGEATLTYDTDRKVGCRWKVESTDATDRLSVDFERVVSYDNAVSDDDEAQTIYTQRESAAGIPESAPPSPTESQSPSGAASGTPSPSASASTTSPSDSTSPTASASTSASASTPPADLQPRTLADLGDEAYLDDQLSGSGSTAEQRTVTVVFRTSNVVVTIEYEEQPMATGTVPDSEELQDRAQNLAAQLAEALNS
ncbi:DUF3558 domain-containing protein [Streptomyces sp. NPDC007157]|uniref:DUF3558 domain-containing protein n=1 Tax=Streptomyces sp. NPDC007157 TaxID=3154681 RepID=UPI0033FB1D4B